MNARIVKKSYGHQVIIVIIALMKSIGEKFLKTGQLLNYQEKKMMFSASQNLRIKYVLWENWNAEIHMAKPGQTVKLTKCLFNDKNGFFFSLENKAIITKLFMFSTTFFMNISNM